MFFVPRFEFVFWRYDPEICHTCSMSPYPAVDECFFFFRRKFWITEDPNIPTKTKQKKLSKTKKEKQKNTHQRLGRGSWGS